MIDSDNISDFTSILIYLSYILQVGLVAYTDYNEHGVMEKDWLLHMKSTGLRKTYLKPKLSKSILPRNAIATFFCSSENCD